MSDALRQLSEALRRGTTSPGTAQGLGTLIPATEGGDTITDDGGNGFSWDKPQKRAMVFNHLSSGVNLYLRWNATSAGLTNYNCVVEPGNNAVAESLLVSKVQIFADGACTYGTDFVVQGWE